jgi:Flp pilus assembly protein TadB
MSALVIVLAPVAFTALATSTDRRTAGFLLRTPFGLTCLTLGIGLDLLGWWWMRRITAIAP